MDIERMKKINSMIPELKKQGFAKTNSEAALQSDAIFHNQGTESIIQQTAHVVGETPNRQMEETNTDKPQNLAPEVIAKIASLEKKVGTIEQDMSAVIEKMNEMISAIMKLEKSSSGAPTETQQKIVKEEPKKQENHVRSGNYTSTDVDINKIFYYGNK